MGRHALSQEKMTVRRGLIIDSPGFSSVIDLNGNDVKLRCAYSLSDSPKPTQVPVRHLWFIVHCGKVKPASPCMMASNVCFSWQNLMATLSLENRILGEGFQVMSRQLGREFSKMPLSPCT